MPKTTKATPNRLDSRFGRAERTGPYAAGVQAACERVGFVNSVVVDLQGNRAGAHEASPADRVAGFAAEELSSCSAENLGSGWEGSSPSSATPRD
jgi:hypothetical protein